MYSTALIVWSFLGQVLRDGKQASCQAVARVVVHQQQTGGPAPTADTGDYCRARQDFQRAYNYTCTRSGTYTTPNSAGWASPSAAASPRRPVRRSSRNVSSSPGCVGRTPAQTILNLRVVLLSGQWDKVYQASVNAYQPLFLRTPAALPRNAGTMLLKSAHQRDRTRFISRLPPLLGA